MIALIVLLVVVVWLAIFIAVNLHEVEINWFFGKTWGLVPLIVIILGSLFIGVILVAIVGGLSQVKLLSQNRSQRGTIKRLEQELAELRSLSFKEIEKPEKAKEGE